MFTCLQVQVTSVRWAASHINRNRSSDEAGLLTLLLPTMHLDL